MRYVFTILLLVSVLSATPRVTFHLYNTGDNEATVYLECQGLTIPGGGTIAAKGVGHFSADSANVPDGEPVSAWMVSQGLVKEGASFVVVPGGGDPVLLVVGYPPPGDGTSEYTYEFAPIGGLLGDDKKTLWALGGTELNAQIYREGVDKLMDAVKSGSGGSADMTETNAKLDAIKTAIEAGPKVSEADKVAERDGNRTELENAVSNPSTGAAASIAASIPSPSPAGNITAASSGASVVIAAFNALGQDWNLLAFASTFWPNFIVYANWIREVLLWGAVFYFAKYSRDQLEKYLALTLLTPQLTTKVAPGQVLVPGVGLAKQIGVATGYVLAVVAVVALTVGMINTSLGTLLSGTTAGNFAAGGASIFNSALGVVSNSYALVSEFIPVYALIQLFFLEISFSWALPTIWATAYMYAKVVHP